MRLDFSQELLMVLLLLLLLLLLLAGIGREGGKDVVLISMPQTDGINL